MPDGTVKESRLVVFTVEGNCVHIALEAQPDVETGGREILLDAERALGLAATQAAWVLR